MEVVDLRTLRPLDRETIAKSVKKTGRVIALSEGYPTNGFATELITVVIEEAFDWLDVPPVRLTSADVPIPMSKILESAVIPDVETVVQAARRLATT